MSFTTSFIYSIILSESFKHKLKLPERDFPKPTKIPSKTLITSSLVILSLNYKVVLATNKLSKASPKFNPKS